METCLIPDSSRKPSKERWLNQSIPYDPTVKKREILEDMAKEAYMWIAETPELAVNVDETSFITDFINMMYHKYR
tara:strand:+ start:656 stop:880 length:225 start_codon:yes stop_codon:yes gene_type:complete